MFKSVSQTFQSEKQVSEQLKHCYFSVTCKVTELKRIFYVSEWPSKILLVTIATHLLSGVLYTVNKNGLRGYVCPSTVLFFSPFWLYSPIQALAASMKLSVSLQLLDLGQSVGLLRRVISSSQGLYLYKKRRKTHTQHKQ
jgi:hypothetical protein